MANCQRTGNHLGIQPHTFVDNVEFLCEELEETTGIKVKVIAKGTGASLQLARDGNADVVYGSRFVGGESIEDQLPVSRSRWRTVHLFPGRHRGIVVRGGDLDG